MKDEDKSESIRDGLRHRLDESQIHRSQPPLGWEPDVPRPAGDVGEPRPEDRPAPPSPPQPPALPMQISNVQLLSLHETGDFPGGVIGDGGEAIVYSYIQHGLARQVAVKTPKPEYRSWIQVEALVREACVTARLEHPNIVPVHYLHLPEHDQDSPYWVMKCIQGRPLDAHLPSGADPWSLDRLREVFERIVEAVVYAHSQGVVHRDLKPGNVLVGEFGEVQVTDWSLAVAITEEGTRGATPALDAPELPLPAEQGEGDDFEGPTISAELVSLHEAVCAGELGALHKDRAMGMGGTPVCMAPEQVMPTAEEIDQRTDVFLLGGILYAMLTGQHPHDLSEEGGDEGVDERIEQIHSCSTIRSPEDRRGALGLRRVCEGLSPVRMEGLSRIVMRALSPDPSDRHQSAQELLHAIRGWDNRATSQELYEQALMWFEQAPSSGRHRSRSLRVALALAQTAINRWEDNQGAKDLRERVGRELDRVHTRLTLMAWSVVAVIMAAVVVITVGLDRITYEKRLVEARAAEAERARAEAERARAEAQHQKEDAIAGRAEARELRTESEELLEVVKSQKKEAVRAQERAEAAARELAERRAEQAKMLDALYMEAYKKFQERGDPMGELLIAATALEHALDNHLDAPRPWPDLAWQAMGACPRRVMAFGRDAAVPRAWSSICFNPRSALLASGADDGAVQIWDPATGRERVALKTAAGGVRCVRFSPDGHLLAAAGSDGTVTLWRADTADREQQLSTQAGGATCVAFSAKGDWLACGTEQGTVMLWQIPGQTRAPLGQHSAAVTDVHFTPDGKGLAAVSEDGAVSVWDVATRTRRDLGREATPVTSVHVSPDGRTVASTGAGGAVILWDLQTHSRTALLGHSRPVTAVRFSPKGGTLASGSLDGAVKLWDVASGRPKAVLRSHPGPVRSIAFSADGTTFASASADGTINLWDLTCLREDVSLAGHTWRVDAASFNIGDNMLASAGWDGSLKLWDLPTGRQVATRHSQVGHVTCVAFGPDGARLAWGTGRGHIELFGVGAGHRATLRGHRKAVRGVAFGPRGQLLVSGSDDGAVRVWDLHTGESTAFDGRAGAVHAVAVGPDGDTIAAGCSNGTVRLWHLGARRQVTLRGHTDRVHTVAFSPDGRGLASGSGDGTIRLWDPAAGQPRGVLGRHSDWVSVSVVAFCPDGRRLASGGGDGVVKLWEVQPRRHISSHRSHSCRVTCLCFESDGSRLASGAADGSLRLRDVTPATAITLERAVQFTGSRLHEFEIASEAVPGPKPSAGAGALPLWGECNPSRWVSDARRDDGEAVFRLALIRERQRDDRTAQTLHHRVGQIEAPSEAEWAQRARARLEHMPWLRPWFPLYTQTVQRVDRGEVQAARAEFEPPSDGEERLRLTHELAQHLLRRARNQLTGRRYDEAERLCRWAAELSPANPEPCDALAMVLVARSREDDALPQVRRAMELRRSELARLQAGAAAPDLHPREPQSFFDAGHTWARSSMREMAWLFGRLGPPGAAVEDLGWSVLGSPDEAAAREELASRLFAAHSYTQSRRVLQPLMSASPPRPKTALLAALCGRELERPQEAVSALEAALAPREGGSAAPEAVADLLEQGVAVEELLGPLATGRPGLAPAFRQTMAAAYAMFAWVRASQEIKTEAVWAQQRAFALAPGNARVHLHLGYADLAMNRPDEAAHHLRVARQTAPDDACLLGHVGWALAGAGRYEAACEAAQRALTLDDSLACAHAALALVWMCRDRDLDNAMPHYSAAAKRDPRRFPRLAIAPLRALLQRRPHAGHAHYALGFCYDQMQQFDAARRHYRLYLATARRGSFARRAKERLAAIGAD